MYYLRNTETVRTDDRQWTGTAIEALLEGDDLVVIDADTGKRVFVSANGIPARTPVWRVIRRELKAAGIKAPRYPK